MTPSPPPCPDCAHRQRLLDAERETTKRQQAEIIRLQTELVRLQNAPPPGCWAAQRTLRACSHHHTEQGA